MPLIWLVFVTLSATESCPTAAARVAKERYARADYKGAVAALGEVEACPDGTEVELADAFRWRAQAKGSLGDTAGAIDAWALAWTVLPTYALDPLESPKFHEQYAQGRSKAASGRFVFGRLIRTVAGRAVVQVFDPNVRVTRVAVEFDHAAIDATKQPDGTWSAIAPAGAITAGVVLENGDAVIFRSLKVMLAELPPPSDEASIVRQAEERRQKWIIVGAAAAGAVVVAAIVTAVALGAKHVDGTLGRVELP